MSKSEAEAADVLICDGGAAGFECDDDGLIQTDETFVTNVAGVRGPLAT